MSPLGTAIRVEFCKTRKSYTIQTITVLVVLGIAILAGSLLAAARRGNEQILAQLGPLADETGWNQLTGISCQITAAGALLAFGVRSEEHTSELQSRGHIVCRLLLEKK